MDKTMQNKNELQEEEIHALLDRAWETERLCVSEDLIQRTLRRVQEEETKVVSFEKVAKRRISPMKYIGVAAAAVFVLALGVRAFGNGGFSLKENVQMEATNHSASRKSEVYFMDSADEASVENGKNGASDHMYYSTNDFDDVSDRIIVNESPVDMEVQAADSAERGTEVRKEDDGMRAMTVELSQMLADVLKNAGMAPVSDNVECWEFAAGETDWERELLNSLTTGVLWENQHPDYGTYRYVLESKDDIRYVMEYNEPLDLIVRIETEQGALWGFLGESSFFFRE